MGGKILAAFTIIAFTVFSLCCYSIKELKFKTDPDLKGKELKVVKLKMKSGEYFEFPAEQSAQISNGSLVGNVILKELVLDKSDIKKTEYGKKGKINRITTKDGKSLNVADFREEDASIIVTVYEYSRIPISEIDTIWVKKNDALATIGAVYLVLAVIMVPVMVLGSGSLINLNLGTWSLLKF
jgi:hypothetical protein